MVLATTVRSTFSVFIYEQPDAVLNITTSGAGSVGFDAGDLGRSSEVPGTALRRLNVFRVDGMSNGNGHVEEYNKQLSAS